MNREKHLQINFKTLGVVALLFFLIGLQHNADYVIDMCTEKTEKKTSSVNIKYSQLIALYADANGFFETYKFLAKQSKENLVDAPLHTVMIANGILSLELFLKWIYAFTISETKTPNNLDNEPVLKYPKSHYLSNLFKRLPENIKQTLITKHFLNYNLPLADAEDFLNQHNNAFEEWRYFFEKDRDLQIDATFLSPLICSLKECCDELMFDYNPKEEWINNKSVSVMIGKYYQNNTVLSSTDFYRKENNSD